MIGIASPIAFAANETITLGPTAISVDLGTIGSYNIEKGDAISMDHKKVGFLYEIIPANIEIEGTSDRVMLEVHELSASQPLDNPISERDSSTGIEHCIARSGMMPVGRDMTTKEYRVNGNKGVLATIENGPNNPLYIIGWCPDQKEGAGSVVCIIGSDLPWETTKQIFDSISYRLV
jgi:hypothetical protein